MKRLYILIALVGCIAIGNAQTAKKMYEAQQEAQIANDTSRKDNCFSIQKGTRYIAGSFGLSAGYVNSFYYTATTSDAVTTPNPFSISLSGEFGGFITDRWSLGLELGYAFNSTPVSQLGNAWLKQRIYLFGFGINVAEYVKITDKFYYNPKISLAYYLGRSTEDIDFSHNIELNVTGFGFGGSLISFEFRPTEQFAIQISVAQYVYTYMNLKNADLRGESHGSNYEIGNAAVGFYYYF